MLSIINKAGWIDTSNGKSYKDALAKTDAFVPDTHPKFDIVVKKQFIVYLVVVHVGIKYLYINI